MIEGRKEIEGIFLCVQQLHIQRGHFEIMKNKFHEMKYISRNFSKTEIFTLKTKLKEIKKKDNNLIIYYIK